MIAQFLISLLLVWVGNGALVDSQSTIRQIAKNEEEMVFRHFVFVANEKKILEHNSNPLKNYTMGINDFTYLTDAEFRRQQLSLIPSNYRSLVMSKALTQNFKQVNKNSSNTLELVWSNGRPISIRVKSEDKSPGEAVTNTSNPQPPPSKPKVLRFRKTFDINSSRRILQSVNVSDQPKQFEEVSLGSIEQGLMEDAVAAFRERGLTDAEIEAIMGQTISTNQTTTASSTVTVVNIQEGTKSARLLLESSLPKPNDLSKNVDWTCVSGPVKVQGACGACYAFATVDNYAAVIAIYNSGVFLDLAAQEIVDCAKNSLSYGCAGGFLEGAFLYMIYGGVLANARYPYEYENVRKPKAECKYLSPNIKRIILRNYELVNVGDCSGMLTVLQRHPITVGITPGQLSQYVSGVFNGCNPNGPIQHAVLLIAFDASKGWKIKNSWGVTWGEKGYAWLSIQNNCRICENAFYPVPEKDYGYDNFVNGNQIQNCK